MENTMLTVAIPCYNGEKTIERCVDSILDQDYRNFELLIINDGSVDNTASIVESLRKKDNRIKVITQENRGLSASRNRAIEECSGEYIAFVDADDSVCPDYLSELYRALIETGADLAACKYYTDKKGDDSGSFITLGQKDMYKELFIPQMNVAAFAWNRLYKLDIIKSAGLLYDARIYGNEDALFNYQYLKYCKKCVIVDKALYHYIINDNSIMFSKGFSQKRMLANIAFNMMLEDAYGKPQLEYVQVGATWYNLIIKRRIKLSKAEVSEADMRTINRMLRLNPKAFITSGVPLKYKLAYPFWVIR